MDVIKKGKRKLRKIRLKGMLGDGNLSADRVERIADTIIAWARKDGAAGVRKDYYLFSFEESFEEISDAIGGLLERGEIKAYRDIYERLYEFARAAMEDSYMPLYLFILYRYGNALLMTGETGKAVRCFDRLLEGTERLIGIENAYGIRCLERLAAAAAADGQKEKALLALDRMEGICGQEFGEGSAMSAAVSRLCRRMRPELSQ